MSSNSGCGCSVVSIFGAISAFILGWFALVGIQVGPQSQAALEPTVLPYQMCAWQWATEDLWDLAVDVQTDLEAAGLEVINVFVFAFGENCLDENGRVSYFAAMQTDFQFTFRVDTVEDAATIGDIVAESIAVIAALPPEQLSGPNPGLVTITVSDGEQRRVVGFSASQIPDWIAQGLGGAALIEAAGGLKMG
jgi:hypothetical protein